MFRIASTLKGLLCPLRSGEACLSWYDSKQSAASLWNLPWLYPVLHVFFLNIGYQKAKKEGLHHYRRGKKLSAAFALLTVLGFVLPTQHITEQNNNIIIIIILQNNEIVHHFVYQNLFFLALFNSLCCGGNVSLFVTTWYIYVYVIQNWKFN